MRLKILLAIVLLAISLNLTAKELLTGKLAGTVNDAATGYPLPHANVIIAELEIGTYTNEKGEFKILDIPVGNYTVAFQLIGHKPQMKSDVIIRSDRTTVIHGSLQKQAVEIEGITATVDFFDEIGTQPTSITGFSNEEIRRAPGSAGDVSRIMMSLPSVAKVNDQSNNLIVRGGNPMENAFYIDNIEIPNINHFPHQGSSGGPIGILNVDFIQDVTFNAGGFSAKYGDKLSSIMELEFREASSENFEGQFDFNWAGIGGILEAPLTQKSNLMIAVKRSYLKYVIDMFDTGTSAAPEYGDIQAKFTYHFNPYHQLSFISVYADDHNEPDQENAEDNFMSHFGNQDLYQGTWGVNWRALWGTNTSSNTSVAITNSRFKEDFYETTTGQYDIRNRSNETELKLRNCNYSRISSNLSIEFGLDYKHLIYDYDNWYNETTNDIGDPVPAFTFDKTEESFKTGAFLTATINPINKLTTNIGMRSDYFSATENVTISPRISSSFSFSDRINLTAAYGIYHQNIPVLLLTQQQSNSNLNDPRAIHYVVGLEYLLSKDTRLVIEAYQKEYKNFPVDPSQPGIFILDDNFFNYYQELEDSGEAMSRGIELVLQKKLAEQIYGLASATFFRSQYKPADGKWRDRDFDNQYIISFEGGYKPNPGLEISGRWIYAGGIPYTPIDVEKSIQAHRAVYDGSQINGKRLPDYHSLNLRVDKRFFFSKSNLVIYASVWNAYNQQNIAEYFWNAKEQKIEEVYQWTLLPIIGVEYEF